MTATKKERILLNHLKECRRKLLVERRVTAEFRRTRVKLQREFMEIIDALKGQNALLQACILKVVKERDSAKKDL